MNLNSLLKQNVKKTANVEYEASENIVDENGKPEKWLLRPLTTREVDRLRAQATVEKFDGRSGMKVSESLDNAQFISELILSSLVDPPRAYFENSELQDSWGVMSAADALREVLDPGEYSGLADKVQEICGFDPIKFDQLVEVAKKN